MVSEQNIGVAPEWIQWQLLRERVVLVQWSIERMDSGEWAIFDGPEEFKKFIPSELPDPELKCIAEYADFAITLGPPRRVGDLSIQKTSDLWGKDDGWWKITSDQSLT